MAQRLTEGLDYYLDDKGLMILTAHFLRKRGYCCGSGCTNCPYSPEEFAEARARKGGRSVLDRLKSAND